MILTISLLTQMAMANSEPTTETPPAIKDRNYNMSTGIRFRQLFIPDALIDNWFYDEDTQGANPFKRPSISAYVVGIEYKFKPRPMNWTIYVEYMGTGLASGYWDDVDQGTDPDHEDGDWVRPDNFGGWFFGGDYTHEFAITPSDKSVWLNLLLGGGLGAGVIQGDLAFWHPGSNAVEDPECYPTAPAYIRKDHCTPDGVKTVPRVVPMIDISLGLEINFADRATIRFDGGLHDMFYYGTSIGAIF